MVQEVFLQAYRKWESFTGRAGADAGTWLYAIAARSCKAKTRRKGGVDRRMPAVSQLMPFRDSKVVELPGPGEGPVSGAVARESARAVHAAILRLPEHFRVALVMKEMLELPIEEVGAALGIKPETVKTRVHRARLLLRKAIVEGARVVKAPAPAPTYEKRVCLDLLKAKLDAMDRGRGFPIGQEVVCERCRAVFAELDLAQNACAGLATGKMPGPVRRAIERALREESRAA